MPATQPPISLKRSEPPHRRTKLRTKPDKRRHAAGVPPEGRVLVVDDDDAIRRVFTRVLRAAGYQVDNAAEGSAGIEMVRQNNYDAIVSDIAMPGCDGIQLLRAVREQDLHVPVVLATGAPSLETAMQAVELGAIRYLTKPLEPSELLDTVSRAVCLRRVGDIRKQIANLSDGGLGALSDLAGLQVRFASALTQMFLVFQPIVSWSERRTVGYEALVRSREPELSNPGLLFDAAERLDRLNIIGRAIRSLCAQRIASAPSDCLLFVNLHTRDLLDPDLFDARSALAEHANRVVLEVTERSKLEQIPDVPGRIRKLRQLGYRVAIDDIGAGYAGLTSFAQLEPDVVKLDMALVRDADRSATKQKLIQSLTTLCRELGMAVVAEGIERPEERDTLYSLGCELMQGYLFAKPAAAFEAPRFDV